MIDFNISNKLSDELILSDGLSLLLQQVDLLFNTDTNSVLGDPSFGSNYDKYLYTLGLSNEALEQKILNDITSLDLYGFNPSVVVRIIEGTERDIALIDITFTGNYEEFNKTYLIK